MQKILWTHSLVAAISILMGVLIHIFIASVPAPLAASCALNILDATVKDVPDGASLPVDVSMAVDVSLASDVTKDGK